MLLDSLLRILSCSFPVGSVRVCVPKKKCVEKEKKAVELVHQRLLLIIGDVRWHSHRSRCREL